MNFNKFAAICLQMGRSTVNKRAPPMLRAGLSTTISRNGVSKMEVHPGYKKIRAKMEKMQIDDGVPVHLKGGPVDVVLFYTTFLACAVGIIGSFDYFYHASFPKKVDEC